MNNRTFYQRLCGASHNNATAVRTTFEGAPQGGVSRTAGSVAVPWRSLGVQSSFPVSGLPPAVRDCDDFDPIRRHTIDNDERETLHQVAPCSHREVCPALWRLPNGATSILEFYLERVRGLLAALGISIVRLERINTSIRVESQRQTSHARAQSFPASRRPTEQA